MVQTPTVPVAVDLAQIPLFPAQLPEAGYQVLQAGHLEEFGFQFGVAGNSFNQADWVDVAGKWRQGYSMLAARLADPADPASTSQTYYLTYVIEWDSEASATAARDVLLNVTMATDPVAIGPVMVASSNAGLSGIGVYGNFVVWTTYSVANPDSATPVVNDVWNPNSLANLNQTTAARIGAVAPGLGQGILRVQGGDAQWSIAWAYYPTNDYYRVLNGQVLPAPGEAASLDPQAKWPGIANLYFSRQVMGNDGFNYDLEIALAQFATPEQAAGWAANPGVVDLPSPLVSGLTVLDQIDLGGGLVQQRVQTAEAQGYRTIFVSGTTVQVVTLFGSGTGQASEGAIGVLTNAQTVCLKAAPAPCGPIPQEQLGVPLRSPDE